MTAASQLLGPISTKAGVIVKFSQNVLIGFAALFISIWWSYRNNSKEKAIENKWKTIWDRFPKFVLGFILASLICSFLIPTDTSKQIGGFLNGIRTLWFALYVLSYRQFDEVPQYYPGTSIMPYQYVGGVRFDPSGLNGADNSHYVSGTGQLSLGEGGVDDAEDADVIIHELGHGLHDWITSGGLSQVNGLSEGLGDYVAGSYSRTTW